MMYKCKKCGVKTAAEYGKCPACGKWGTIQPISGNKKSKGTIAPESKKRIKAKQKYNKICRELDLSGAPCFFSGQKIPAGMQCDHHHIAGRDGDLYAKKSNIKRAIRKYHMQWHDYTIAQLEQEPWWKGHVERVKIENPEHYAIILKRKEREQNNDH